MTEYHATAAQLLVMKQIPVGVPCPDQGFIRIEATQVEQYHNDGYQIVVMLTSGRTYTVNQLQPGRGKYFALDKT